MSRIVVAAVAVLASCGLPSGSARDDVPDARCAPPPASPALPVDGTPVALPLHVAVPHLVHAAHDDRMIALAITEDAAVAVSADAHGSVRLWPSLDGEHEPVVVAARAPAALAIVRDGDGVAFAGIDATGQLEVVRTTALGAPRERLSIDVPRPIVEVRAVRGGFLALRDDGAIDRIAASGARLGELAPHVHEHVSTLAVRRGAALAIVETSEGVRGRWIDVERTRWRNATPELAIDASHAELSPSHHRLAAATPDGQGVEIVDLATGKQVASFPGTRPIGFAGEDLLAIADPEDDGRPQDRETIEWEDVDLASALYTVSHATVPTIGDAHLVGVEAGGLVIVEPRSGTAPPRTKYLGYRVGLLGNLRATRDGWLATDGMAVVAIDDSLKTRRTYDLSAIAGRSGLYGAQLVDDGHAIAEGYDDSHSFVCLVAFARDRATTLASDAHLIGYEPQQHVLAYRSDQQIRFRRYDPDRAEFGAEASVAIARGAEVYVRLAAPMAIVTAKYGADAASITRIRGIARDGRIDVASVRTVKLRPGFWQTDADLGALVAPGVPPAAIVRGNADGSLVASLQGPRITVRDAAGATRWTGIALGATDLAWASDGHLVAWGLGMARFDGATGELVERQCGWGFGLWDSPPETPGAQICEMP